MICDLIISSIAQDKQSKHLFSVDEKTGIQALERTSVCNSRPGKIRLIEYEYVRHGTTCLIGGLNVSNGKLEHYRLHPTRKEQDFLVFIKGMCKPVSKEHEIVILLDQLNTHMSASLVRWVATQIGFQPDLGIKGSKGILKNKKTRMTFLGNPEHRIRFVYTPKHCSWLNPIENWFGKFQRQAMKNGNFTSIDHLVSCIEKYIEFSNDYFAKPYQWKFKGFVKSYKLNAIKLNG